MSTFRARLRPPKRTLWLGCEIELVEMRRAKANGRPYALVRFRNMPLVATWNEYEHFAFIRVLEEREVEPPANELRVGMLVNVDVRWELVDIGREPELLPRAKIDFYSVESQYR